MAKVVRHYLIGYDRPNPGQQKTMFPSGNVPDLPESDIAMVDFSRRMSMRPSTDGPNSVVYSAAPWHDLVLVGRFEKTHDSANPPREVEHIHVMLLDITDTASSLILSPLKLADKFVSAEQYSLFPESFDDFNKLIKSELLSRAITLAAVTQISETDCTIDYGLGITRELAGSTGNLSIGETDNLLNRLPGMVANRVAWTVDGSKLPPVSVDDRDSENDEQAADVISDKSLAELLTAAHAQSVSQLFDLVFPICSIELALELIAEFSNGHGEQRGCSDQFIAAGAARLVSMGYAPERLVLSLVSNAIYVDRKYGAEAISLVSTCISGLFPENQEHALGELGSPYLASLLDVYRDSGSDGSSGAESKLLIAVDRDVEFRSYLEELQIEPEFGVRAILAGDSAHPEHGFVYAIKHLDSKLWIERVRVILLSAEGGSTGEFDSLIAFTDLASSVRDGEFAGVWFGIVHDAMSERRGLISKLLKRDTAVSLILQSDEASSRYEFLNRLAEAFEAGIWSTVPTGLVRLIYDLQPK